MNFNHFLQESKIVEAIEQENLNAPELKQTPADWSNAKTADELIKELGL